MAPRVAPSTLRTLPAAPIALPAQRRATPNQPPASWGLEQALAALHDAAPALGLPAAALQRARVVQVVSTAVFEVDGLAVKVYPATTDAERLRAVAAALGEGAADCWVLPSSGVLADGTGVVVAYPWVPSAEPVGWGEVGALVRRWHDCEVPLEALPAWTPLSRLPAQIGAYAALPSADPGLARVAMEARLRLLERASNLSTGLGRGAIHGDVSPSNVLRRNGSPVFIDSDFVARGPLEYDLVPAAQRRERGGMSEADYAEFCAAYGFDVREWSGLGTVEEICGLGAVTFRLWCAVQRGEDVSWLGEALSGYV